MSKEKTTFSIAGTDYYCGPVTVKDGQGNELKSYRCLFICPISRCAHLEQTLSLTAFDFLLVLRKFTCRFPSVKKLVIDNAQTLRRAEKELEIVRGNISSRKIQDFFGRKTPFMEIVTDRAPTHGSFYERGGGSEDTARQDHYVRWTSSSVSTHRVDSQIHQS